MITANVWNIFCFCSSLRYFLLLHCKVLHQAGYLLSCIGPMNFWTEVTRASISKYRPEPRHSWRTFCNHMLMHATKFAQHLLNHLRSIAMFAFTQLNSIWAAFMLPLSSHYIHSVALALRHTHAAAALRALHWSSRRHAKEAEGPKIWSNSEGHCWDLRQLPSLMQHCVHAEGCSPTRCLSTTFCALLVS